MTHQERIRNLKTVLRLYQLYDSFLELYPDDVTTPEGQAYCINNVIQDTCSLLATISNRLTVQKDINASDAFDLYQMIMAHACDIMSQITGEENTLCTMGADELMINISVLEGMKEGDNNEML